MEPEVYARMAELEQDHWWFVARRAILVEVLTRLVDLPPTARALEAMGHHIEESHPAALDDPQVVATYVNIVTCNVARALDAWADKVSADNPGKSK